MGLSKLFFVFFIFLSGNSLYGVANTNPSQADFRDWFALGSGCNAQDKSLNNVKMKVSTDPQNPNQYQVLFDMGSYRLSGNKPINKEDPNFARECSLRFSIYPPPFTRLKNVEANTRFLISKDKGAKTELHTRLLLPQGTLKDWQHISEREINLKNEKVTMYLSPDEKGKKMLNAISCGEAKIIGLDLGFENKRQSFKPKVDMKHDKPNTVEFLVELESCKS